MTSHSLSDGQQSFQSVITVTDEISLKGVQAGVGLVMATIPALLLFCMYWNTYHNNSHRCLDIFRGCFLWPIFVTMVILCLIICCGIIIGGLLNADFCSGGYDQSPDSTIIEILDNQGTDPNSHCVCDQCEYNFMPFVIHFLQGLVNSAGRDHTTEYRRPGSISCTRRSPFSLSTMTGSPTKT